MIARHFFDRAAEHGRRPLLVCFNRPLSERVKAIVRPGGLVTTFYGLCTQFLRERGQHLDFEEMKRDRQFWEKIFARPGPRRARRRGSRGRIGTTSGGPRCGTA